MTELFDCKYDSDHPPNRWWNCCCLKAHYRKQLIKELVLRLDCGQDKENENGTKSISVLDVPLCFKMQGNA